MAPRECCCGVAITAELKSMMGISDSLAELNHNRFQTFQTGLEASSIAPGEDFKQTLLAFDGPVCKGEGIVEVVLIHEIRLNDAECAGIDPESLSDDDLEFAQEHVRLLSGLYGVLRPLDLIQPYRLEMGSKRLGMSTADGAVNTLYDYWGESIGEQLLADLEKGRRQGSDVWIVNLASQEYAKAACLPMLEGRGVKVLQCVFKDEGRVMSVFAKRARGLMTRFIIDNRVTNDIDVLKRFDLEGYQFSERESSELEFVYNRPASRRPQPKSSAVASTAASKSGNGAAKRSKKKTENEEEGDDVTAESSTAHAAPSTRKRTRKSAA